MIFSNKTFDRQAEELTSSLLRVVQQLLQGCSLHSVEFDSDVHAEFRSSIRQIADRFDELPDYKELLILAGEANKTIQTYNHQVEKFIRDLAVEKQLAVELLAKSLLKVCRSSDKTALTLRQIERDLSKASQLQDMRDLRAKLAECVGTLCLEAEAQEAQYRELKERLAEPTNALEPLDQITGLNTMKRAEARLQEVAVGGYQGFVLVFFLKNVDVVNRRFGFSAGDQVLLKFANYLKNSFRASEQIFRWRGPCFVVLAERFVTLDAVKAEAHKVGIRGPEAEVEGNAKSMLIRLTAATTSFQIPKGSAVAELPSKIDQFASEQFKASPAS
jgi:diguanylate cyclase (GGDEF)-like protein